jgi:L-iditol 2-dehydrogenase
MKALVKTQDGPGSLELVDWPQPQVGPDDVLIEIAYSGICGTDVHILEGRWPCTTPLVLGHEFSGRVVEVGKNVHDIAEGDRVTAGNPARTCGMCLHCRKGNAFMCPQRISLGFMIDGAFTRFITVRKHTIHRIPQGVSMEEAAVCEPMSAGVRGLTERYTIHAGDRVLVCGAGPIALLAAAVAHAEGAQVIVCGLNIDRKRLAIAQNMGIVTDTVNLEQDDLAATVDRLTQGQSMDVVVECAGAPASLDNCLKHVRKGGTLIQIGIYAKPFEVDFSQLVMNELQFIGVYGHVWSTWEKSLAFMRDKKVDVRPLITHKLPMPQWEDGLDAIHNGDAIKVLLEPV